MRKSKENPRGENVTTPSFYTLGVMKSRKTSNDQGDFKNQHVKTTCSQHENESQEH